MEQAFDLEAEFGAPLEGRWAVRDERHCGGGQEAAATGEARPGEARPGAPGGSGREAPAQASGGARRAVPAESSGGTGRQAPEEAGEVRGAPSPTREELFADLADGGVGAAGGAVGGLASVQALAMRLTRAQHAATEAERVAEGLRQELAGEREARLVAEARRDVLLDNISRLYATAKEELFRKDSEIRELREKVMGIGSQGRERGGDGAAGGRGVQGSYREQGATGWRSAPGIEGSRTARLKPQGMGRDARCDHSPQDDGFRVLSRDQRQRGLDSHERERPSQQRLRGDGSEGDRGDRREGDREGGCGGRREGSREGGYGDRREGGREGGYGGRREGGREGGYGDRREGGREGGYGDRREGGREGGYGDRREGGREGGYGDHRGGSREGDFVERRER